MTCLNGYYEVEQCTVKRIQVVAKKVQAAQDAACFIELVHAG